MTSFERNAEAIRTAYQEYQAGDLAAAGQRARQIVRIDPNFAPAYHLLGLIHERQGDRDAARAEFQIAARKGYKPAAAKLGEYRAPAPQRRSRADRREIAEGYRSQEAKLERRVEKQPCIECGKLILPRTAEKTRGHCMPCFRRMPSTKVKIKPFKFVETIPVFRNQINCPKCNDSIDVNLKQPTTIKPSNRYPRRGDVVKCVNCNSLFKFVETIPVFRNQINCPKCNDSIDVN